MCYSASSNIAAESTTSLPQCCFFGEKQPLMQKRISCNSKTISASGSNDTTSTTFLIMTSITDCSKAALNKISCITAIIGIVWYCIYLVQGEYTKWGLPLFVGAITCKLFSTSSNVMQSSMGTDKISGIMLPRTFYQRIKTTKALNRCNNIYQKLSQNIKNDNNYNVIFLSTIIIILPSTIYFLTKINGHLASFREKNQDIDHTKLANDFGKLAAICLTFLLLPVSKNSSFISSALKLSDVHMLRLHICSGYMVLFGGVVHGLYYTVIWIKVKDYKYQDVFPSISCFTSNYDEDCYDNFVNITGIISGILLVILGTSSLYYIRRHYYSIFYTLHIIISISILFGLVMHYNKMIWYMAPSLLYYVASNIPIYMECLYKWIRLGGVKVTKVVCIPDSSGCVDVSICIDDCSSYQETTGRYILLSVPELSTLSHPFTLFKGLDENTVHILFRPCGAFTIALSKRLKALTLLPEPTPSEIESHHSSQRREEECPKMLVNGIQYSTTDMLLNATKVHDKVVIIAGGVGIVTYISLIQSIIQLQQEKSVITMNTATQPDEEELFRIEDDNEKEEDETSNAGMLDVTRSRSRCIDVHWMSRDEGLIRHVLENYFSHPPPGDMSLNNITSNGNVASPSINLVVHHTASSSSSLATSNNGNNINDSELTTWELSTRQQYNDGSNQHSLFAVPESIYESNKPYLTPNILPTITFASIVFGGMWIIQYSYDNIQAKHIVETRTISVVGILFLALIVSVLSNIIAIIGQTIYSKLFRYTKLPEEIGSNSSSYNDDNDIELSKEVGHDVAEETSTYNNIVNTSQTKEDLLKISHSFGRPNFTTIIHDIVKQDGSRMEQEKDSLNDVGIFMCGPAAMTNSVWKAVKKEESSFCITKGAVINVYQETFEL